MPVPGWKVTLEGRDLTGTMQPRLLSLTLIEKRGTEADQLDIVLSDADGALEIPPSGARLTVALGWRQGRGREAGLVGKGTFKVDEARWGGPIDRLTITARSADFTDGFRVRRERSFVGRTVSEIVSQIASENGLAARVDEALGAKTIPALGPGAKSDAALLKLLGKRFDAVATVKFGTLLFAPIGSGSSAGGKPLARRIIARSQTVDVEYARVERDAHDGVAASWHDKVSGERRSVDAGHAGKGKAKRIRKVFASEADAKQAAEAENARMQRLKAKASVTLAQGAPDIFPETPVTLEGFKTEINARKWIVAEATHEMDGGGGLRTRLALEAVD